MVAKGRSKNIIQAANYLRNSDETELIQSDSALWHLRGAEGDHLSERSEGGKLPEQETRRPRRFREVESLLKGCSGGSAEGAEEGRSP